MQGGLGQCGSLWKVVCTLRKELPKEEGEALAHGLDVREMSGTESGGVGFGLARQ